MSQYKEVYDYGSDLYIYSIKIEYSKIFYVMRQYNKYNVLYKTINNKIYKKYISKENANYILKNHKIPAELL